MMDPLNMLFERIENLNKNLKIFSDSKNQHAETARSVASFVEHVLNHVNDNPDIPGVNKILADALIEVRRYVSNRNADIEKTLLLYDSKLQSYQECVEILRAAEASRQDDEVQISDQSSEPPEDRISRIIDNLDEDGRLPVRKLGERPEKLREVREAQEKLMAPDILKKDI